MTASPVKATSSSSAGSEDCPFKLAIVGGGPSGCSVIVRAMRIGALSELCGFSYLESSPSRQKTPYQAGVCLVDRGTLSRFGGGCLQDYVINSNTYVGKFVSNVVHEKPENLPPEHTRNTPLERLGAVASARELERLGNRTGPLETVGRFLCDVGQTIFSVLQQFPQSSRCHVGTNVDSLQQVLDEHGQFLYWRITLSRAASTSPAGPAPASPGSGESGRGEGNVEQVYAKHVVLSTGGYQEIPRFPGHSTLESKIMVSDAACTAQGVELLKQRIRRHLRSGGSGRVAIVGGSHSAFSAAWVCLHHVQEVDARKGAIHPMPPSSPSTRTPAGGDKSSSASSGGDPSPKIVFGSSSICILHRSPIKVFYATRAEADADNYPDYCVNKITGQINPFGGIRGDAKELWKAIRSGKECRVRLLQVRSAIGSNPANQETAWGGVKQSIVDRLLEESAVIIWACGYTTHLPPVLSHTGGVMPLARDKGQVRVDEQARILVQESPPASRTPSRHPNHPPTPTSSSSSSSSSSCSIVPGLYGSGLGYGLRASLDNGEADGSSGRADGVAVYLKRGATLVLGHILGDKVFGGLGIRSWEERNLLLRRQMYAARASSQSDTTEEGETRDEGGAQCVTPSRGTCATVSTPSTSSSSTGGGGGRPASTSRARPASTAAASAGPSPLTRRSLTPHSLRNISNRGQTASSTIGGGRRPGPLPGKDGRPWGRSLDSSPTPTMSTALVPKTVTIGTSLPTPSKS